MYAHFDVHFWMPAVMSDMLLLMNSPKSATGHAPHRAWQRHTQRLKDPLQLDDKAHRSPYHEALAPLNRSHSTP